jgi:antitoxin component YwqK of YwqJK toxin-antitoxin module
MNDENNINSQLSNTINDIDYQSYNNIPSDVVSNLGLKVDAYQYEDGGKITLISTNSDTKITQYDNTNGTHSIVQNFENGDQIVTNYDSNWIPFGETRKQGYDTTVVKFYPTGKIQSEKTNDYWGNVISEKQYYSNGKLELETVKDTDGNTTQIGYSPTGKIESEIKTNVFGAKVNERLVGKNNSETNNKYNEWGNLELTTQTQNDTAGNQARYESEDSNWKYNKKYNAKGMLISETIVNKNNGNTIEKIYSSTGQVIKETNTDIFGTKTSTEKVYSSTGQVVEETHIDKDGYKTKIERSYYPTGEIQKEIEIGPFDKQIEKEYSQTGMIQSSLTTSNDGTVDIKYDSQGKVLTAKILDSSGKLESTVSNVNGNNVMIVYHPNGRPSEIHNKDGSTYYDSSGKKKSYSGYDSDGNDIVIYYNENGYPKEKYNRTTSEKTIYNYNDDSIRLMQEANVDPDKIEKYRLANTTTTNENNKDEYVTFYGEDGNPIGYRLSHTNENGTKKTTWKSVNNEIEDECYDIGDKSIRIGYSADDVNIDNEESLYDKREAWYKSDELDEYYRCINEGRYQEKLEAISNMEADLVQILTLTEDDMKLFKGLSGKEMLSIYTYLVYGAERLNNYISGPIKELKVNITLLLIKLEERKNIKDILSRKLDYKKDILSDISRVDRKIVIDEFGTTKTNPKYTTLQTQLVECNNEITELESKLEITEKEVKASIDKIDNIERYSAKDLKLYYPVA